MISNLKKMRELCLSKPVTFLVGENGVGKSTLIEGIAVAMGFNPEGGTVNFNFATKESHSNLHEYLTVSRGYKKHKDGFFLRAESLSGLRSIMTENSKKEKFRYGTAAVTFRALKILQSRCTITEQVRTRLRRLPLIL